MARVSLIRLDGTIVHISKPLARLMLAKQRAIEVDSRTLRTLESKSHVKAGKLKCGQSVAYLTAATDKHPRFFQGGLTRNEHQPNPKPGILSWGHIGENKSASKPHSHIRPQRRSHD